MKPFTIIFVVIAILGLGGTGYFFIQTQSLEKEFVLLKDVKSKVETELAILKSTDLAKENEFLKSTLKSTEDAFALEKRNHENTQNRLTEAESKIKTLETATKRAQSYVGVLSAFNDWQFAASPLPLIDRDTRSIDTAISSLGDSHASNLWREIKVGFPMAKQTGNLRYEEVIILITSKLASLLIK